MTIPRRVRSGAWLCLLPIVIAASSCSSPASNTAATVTVTETVTPTLTPTRDGSAASDTTATDAPDPTPPIETTETDSPSTLPKEKSGQPLVLADFFAPDATWSEGLADVADKKSVKGINAEVNSCYKESPRTLEIRLANAFDSFSFSFGEANNSPASNQALVIEVLGDGDKQKDIKRVEFNHIQKVTVPVTGTNALKLNAYLDDQVQDCGSSVRAVITDVVAR